MGFMAEVTLDIYINVSVRSIQIVDISDTRQECYRSAIMYAV